MPPRPERRRDDASSVWVMGVDPSGRNPMLQPTLRRRRIRRRSAPGRDRAGCSRSAKPRSNRRARRGPAHAARANGRSARGSRPADPSARQLDPRKVYTEARHCPAARPGARRRRGHVRAAAGRPERAVADEPVAEEVRERRPRPLLRASDTATGAARSSGRRPPKRAPEEACADQVRRRLTRIGPLTSQWDAHWRRGPALADERGGPVRWASAAKRTSDRRTPAVGYTDCRCWFRRPACLCSRSRSSAGAPRAGARAASCRPVEAADEDEPVSLRSAMERPL